MSRRARTDESRADQSRKGEARPPMRSRFSGNLALPESVLKDAKARKMRLHWMATSVYGDEGSASVQLSNRMLRGWTPVAASRYPELIPIVLPGRKLSEVIERGGQILMEKPLHEWQADREELRRENMRDMQAIKWSDAATSDLMPKYEADGGNQVMHRRVVESGGEPSQGGPQFQDE